MSGGGHALFENSVEVLSLGLLIAGLVISLLSPNLFLTYLIIFLAGMMAGRLMWERKHDPHFPHYLIMGGFLIGYFVGVLIHGGSVILVTIFFIGGALTAYQLLKKGMIHDTFV